MQKHGSKDVFMLNEISDKHFNIFRVFVDTTENFIKRFSLCKAGAAHISFYVLYDLFFVCLIVWLRACWS